MFRAKIEFFVYFKFRWYRVEVLCAAEETLLEISYLSIV